MLRIGDIIKVSIKEAIPRGKVKKGDVYNAVVVRTGKGVRRSRWFFIRFDGNAAVFLNAQITNQLVRVFLALLLVSYVEKIYENYFSSSRSFVRKD